MKFIVLLIFLSGFATSLFLRLRRRPIDDAWRKVPPPNWRSSRGGNEYF